MADNTSPEDLQRDVLTGQTYLPDGGGGGGERMGGDGGGERQFANQAVIMQNEAYCNMEYQTDR